MNIQELEKINSTILSEEEMINVLGGENVENSEITKPGENSEKCNKCDKCDKCTWFC
ncbi:hypothetical protein IMSAGC004_00304 [Bacteroidaceae bacterium]|nr:hypothetical protein IMSAGC004_00304 [Bacteroidaceae bacterium]